MILDCKDVRLELEGQQGWQEGLVRGFDTPWIWHILVDNELH
jgi:hypothetical protein